MQPSSNSIALHATTAPSPMRVCIALFLALGFPLMPSCACEEDVSRVILPGTITGRICDPGAGLGIFGATVWVEEEQADGSIRVIDTTSDADGAFTLEDVPVGTWNLFVRRGSFRATLEGVEVREEETTELDEAACIPPVDVTMTVYAGHDSVEDVLSRLGYADYTLVETHDRAFERPEDQPSWLVEEFGTLANFQDNDILFINCGAHEWAVEKATDAELAQVLTNLRTFVGQGGSIYMSDWAYDLFELLYPDAVEWYGDDDVENAAERGQQQDFLGFIQDPVIAAEMTSARASLRYNQGRIAMPTGLGEGARALVVADVDVEDENDNTERLQDVPVLIEYRPPAGDPETVGRVLYTTFHNGAQNTEDMDAILRAMIFSL